MGRVDMLLTQLSQKFGLRLDTTDSRFTAVASADPVELDVAGYLYALVRLLKAHTVVETGTNVGISTLSMAKALADDGLPGARIISFDIENYGVPSLASHHRLEHIVSFRQHSSLESTLQNEVAKIDLLFLDSLPSLLMEELEHFWPLLHRHSVIVIHDSRLFGEKTMAIDAFKDRYKWEGVSTHVGRGVTILAAGTKGLIAQFSIPTYTLLADLSAVVEGNKIFDQWPLDIQPQQVVWLGNQSAHLKSVFKDAKYDAAQTLSEAFSKLMSTQTDYILYLDCSLDQIASPLQAAWGYLQKAERPTYATSPETPQIPWNKGGHEIQWLLPRWKKAPDANTTIEMPYLSQGLFFVNRALWQQLAFEESETLDKDWYFATMIFRMHLTGGKMEPTYTADAPNVVPVQKNGLAGHQSLKSISSFYRHMHTPLHEELRRNWRRIMRIYYFGAGHEHLSWSSFLRQPASLISILRCWM